MRLSLALLTLLAACHKSPTSAVVHAANLIELSGPAGDLQLSAVADGAPALNATMTVAAFPWHGKVVTVAPALPFPDGVASWTLTFQRSGTAARTVKLVPLQATGTPGAALLAFADQLATLDQSLKAPADSAMAARFAQATADMKSVAGFAHSTAQSAQSAPTAVGTWNGVTASVDAKGLAMLDAMVAGAQEPMVAEAPSSATVQGLSSPDTVTSSLLVSLGVATGLALTVTTAPAVVAGLGFAGGLTLFMGALFLGEGLAQQAVDLVAASDPSGPAAVAGVDGALQWGTNLHASKWASNLVAANGSGTTAYMAFLASRGALPPPCDPAACAAQSAVCLSCSPLWTGCFSSGSSCCGSGNGSPACPSYADCATCDGVLACVMHGGTCPTSSGGITYAISISTTGGGTVSASPAGLHYAPGTAVTLTASPNAGYTFDGWGGDCAGTGACALVMSSDRVVTASFSPGGGAAYSITASVAGAGAAYGSISRDKAGPAYPPGTVVTLTAQPAASNATFHGWSGDCSGAGSCVLTMNANKNVTATFDLVNPADPCGVAGVWTTSCPSQLCCASCSGSMNALSFSFTISAQVAQSGGTWTDNPGGDTYTFVPSSCTLTTYGSQSTACWSSYTWQRVLQNRAGSFRNVCGCWDTSNTCQCTSFYTCTDAKQ